MKFSSLPSRWTLAFALCCVAAPVLTAQDITPPYVATPISDVSVAVNSAPTKINLKKTFALTGVTGPLVRFTTTLGNVDVEMLTQNAPNTVATFLGYAHTASVNSPTNITYNYTLIQRVYDGFAANGGGVIVQGGGYYVDSSNAIDQIAGRPTIASEAGVKNTRGTLAMALRNGPDTATGEWFFNVGGDNPSLDDTSVGGPFTVFGRTVGSTATLNAIVALPQEDFSQQLGQAFMNVPLVNFTGGQAGIENLVYLQSITDLPVVAKADGDAAALAITVSNSNPDLVTATLKGGKKLTLTYAPGMTGTAVIKVKAKDSAKVSAKAKFTVTVQ